VSTTRSKLLRSLRPKLSPWERALLAAMVLLALGQGLLCSAAPNEVGRVLSLVACLGATGYAAWLTLSACRR
jgi:hypothetical protein